MRNKFLASVLVIVSLIVPCILFSYTAYNSWGYDDEIFNIRHVESYDSLYSLVKAHLDNPIADGRLLDIHPLGQYVINYALLKILGSWNLVRVAGAVIASLSLWLFWRCTMRIRNTKDVSALLLSYMLICVNPSVMLWCTGLRWYTYFMPLVCLIGVLFEPPKYLDSRKYLFWGVYFLTASVMFYLETSASIMTALSFVLLLIQRRAKLRQEVGAVLVFGILSLAFVSRQIYLLLTVIFPRVSDSGEFYSLASSFIGGGQNFLSGHAVIPVSVPGIILIAANLVFIAFVFHCKGVMSSWRNKFFVLSYIGIIAARLGGKIRNFISTSALLGIFITDTFQLIKNKKVKTLILCMYLIGTVWGVYNVMSHNDTTKGLWNTPYSEVIEFLEGYDKDRKYPVMTHDPSLIYHAEMRGFDVINVEAGYDHWHNKTNGISGSVIAVKTFKGLLSKDNYEKFNSYISGRKTVLEKRFGYDKFAGFKRLFDKECPDYYAVVAVTE